MALDATFSDAALSIFEKIVFRSRLQPTSSPQQALAAEALASAHLLHEKARGVCQMWLMWTWGSWATTHELERVTTLQRSRRSTYPLGNKVRFDVETMSKQYRNHENYGAHTH